MKPLSEMRGRTQPFKSTTASMSLYVGNHIAVPGVRRFPRLAMQIVFMLCIGSIFARPQTPAPPWRGVLQNEAGSPIRKADVKLDSADDHETARTSTNGSFVFTSLRPATYSLSVHVNKQVFRSTAAIVIPAQATMVTLTVKQNGDLLVGIQREKAAAGGEQLTSKAVSEIPLNKRDFSQLLLLTAGTAADPSGASTLHNSSRSMANVASKLCSHSTVPISAIQRLEEEHSPTSTLMPCSNFNLFPESCLLSSVEALPDLPIS